MTLPQELDASRTLLDHLVMDHEGKPLGRVDDIQLEISDGGPPVMTALLMGPLALGTRLGGRLGTWWVSVARRLRRETSPEPARVPFVAVTELRPGEVRLGLLRSEHEPRLMQWTREKVIKPIPGSGGNA
jgi:sporulation protein YlmC with PRC-barrel domain